jgi:hypothetical protein
MTQNETPEEWGERMALESMRRRMGKVQTEAALEACFLEIVKLLISKKVLGSQEVLDALANASDSIQRQPDSVIGVQTVERLCKEIADPGAQRQGGSCARLRLRA